MVQKIDDAEKMTPEQFAYWMQGFFEMSESNTLTDKQVKMIRDHLALVFKKETPMYAITTTPIFPDKLDGDKPTGVIC